MASSSFDNAVDDFTELKKAIENLISNKLARAQKENRKLVLNDINRRLDAAEVALKEMQREVDKASAGTRPKLSYQFRAYQSEFNNLTRQIESAKQQNSGPNDSWNQPDSTRRQVVGNQGAVERSTAAITRTERLAVETENIGNEITTELGQQREQLVRTRDMLDQTDSALDKSRRTLLNMARKAVTNKIALISIIIVEVLILASVLYWKFK
ncbi:vesicle transport through interaction with t-SNAREs homolog 1B-like [Bolinopsis microptera]|uniref:vesicle transport through interaction with t-SNAREs homolog 1B-like n=1 Tax=Bolinopsis microptera TaxID=2820187 RepID=UPI00307A6F03